MADNNSAQEPTNFPVGNRDEVPSQSPDKPAGASRANPGAAAGPSIEDPKDDPNRQNAKPAADEADRKL